MPRVVAFYQKYGDVRLGEIELPDLPLDVLQAAFGEQDSNPMYDCYPVGRNHADQIFKWTGVKVRLDDFDYFLEFHK